jgi:hypothetical protein
MWRIVVQKRWKTLRTLLFLASVYDVTPAFAQQTTDAQREAIRRLQERIDQQQAQLSQMQSELDALRGVKAPAAAATVPDAGAIASKPVPPTPTLTAEEQLEAIGRATQEHHTFAQDESDAPRLDNAPHEPTYPGFFYLPGTHTMMRIDGFARTDFIADPRSSGLGDSFVPGTIPIPLSGPSQFTAGIRGSRLQADFRTPVGDRGSARAFFQLDFFGPNGTTAPRLRHYYAQLNNILVGQTFTNFMDPDAFPDTMDTQGVNSAISVRIPQARYSFGLGKGWSGFVSIEQPSTNISSLPADAGFQPLTRAPDGSLRLRKEWEGGHFQVASIFRDLAVRMPDGTHHSLFGWGVNGTGGIQLFGRDNIVLGIAYGNGISRYVGDTGGLGLDLAPRSATDLSLQALPLFSTYGSYQHMWTDRLRSNATFGYVQVQNTAFQSGDIYHKSSYSSANLVWNPVGSLDLGAEFIYGWVQNKGGASANAPRFQFTGRYRFVNHKQ